MSGFSSANKSHEEDYKHKEEEAFIKAVDLCVVIVAASAGHCIYGSTPEKAGLRGIFQSCTGQFINVAVFV